MPPSPQGADRAAAFDELLAAHRGIALKVAASYARDSEERRDLAQEILTEVWRAYPRYDSGRRFSTWMYRIALNVAISHQRSARVRDRHAAAMEGDDLLNVPNPPDRQSDERLRELHRLISKLDHLHRALVVLYLDGHSHAEISEVLGITATNVATKLNRLKERLRNEVHSANAAEGKSNGNR